MNVIVDFYSEYDEQSRLAELNSLERIRSQEIIGRYVDAPRKTIIDIGGAAGVYSFWLASLGHDVTLVDLTPKHVEQALKTNEAAVAKLSRIEAGDALDLRFPDRAFDMALLMGPLYHLLEREKRIRAIREAGRVAKRGGHVIVAAISRFASMLDGYKYDLVSDPDYRKILDRDLATGDHFNDSGNPGYFTTSRFHLDSELRAEIAEGGLLVEKVLAVEGFAHWISGVEERMGDAEYRDYLLQKLRDTEEEASLIGVSSHLLGIGRVE